MLLEKAKVTKMNDEYSKLVAKIQHFYDTLAQSIREYEDLALSATSDSERTTYKSKCAELTRQADEFSKVFQEFLYKQPV